MAPDREGRFASNRHSFRGENSLGEPDSVSNGFSLMSVDNVSETRLSQENRSLTRIFGHHRLSPRSG